MKSDGYSSFNQFASKADVRHRPVISHVSCVKTRFFKPWCYDGMALGNW